MKRPLRFLVPLIAVFCSTLPARAQHISSPYRFLDTSQDVGAYISHIRGGLGAVGLGSQSGTAYGARYGLRLSGPLALDVGALYFPTHVAVLDTAVVDSAFKVITTANQPLAIVMASLRFNLTGPRTWNGLLPYVGFGLGGVFETSKDKGAVEQAPIEARYVFGTSFAGVLSAGLEFFPTDRVSIRVDGRNILWKIKTPAALLRGTLGQTMPADEWVNNISTSAGVSVHF